MAKNKCTLLIDGNWLLISRFSVMKKLFEADQSEAQLNSATENLKDMMARSINFMINKFPQIDNIIFISDGGSWRKQLRVPEQLNDITYKGNREDDKGSDVSWKHVFKALNDLSKACRSQGITTVTQSNIEGDDWVWYWSRRLNAEGINCIIWSSDHDLMQLVQNKNSVFTAWYYERSGKNPRKEIAFHNSFELKNPDPDDLDFFMQPIVYQPPLLEQLSKMASDTLYVDPNTIILSKVICGDSGDNIKPVARIVKGGRTYGVGPKDWEKISIKLNINTIQDLIEGTNIIATEISKLKKFDGQVTSQQIAEMIEYNIKLVWLNEAVIPDTVVDVMNNSEYNVVDVNYFRGSYRLFLGGDTNDIENIFEGVM